MPRVARVRIAFGRVFALPGLHGRQHLGLRRRRVRQAQRAALCLVKGFVRLSKLHVFSILRISSKSGKTSSPASGQRGCVSDDVTPKGIAVGWSEIRERGGDDDFVHRLVRIERVMQIPFGEVAAGEKPDQPPANALRRLKVAKSALRTHFP